MPLYRYLTADTSPSPQILSLPEGRVYQFSDDYLLALWPNARAELRNRSRGSLLLASLIAQVYRETPVISNTGVYLWTTMGPFHPKTQELALQTPPGDRLALLERAVPPKDHIVSHSGLKAAQVCIEFLLHGPWICFPSPQFGFLQAFGHAAADLAVGVVEAAWIGGIFTLDEQQDRARFFKESPELSECLFVQYATGPEDCAETGGALGRYGPLTERLERIINHEQNQH